MATEAQKIESKKICKEFLTLNKKLGFYNGSTNTYFNSEARKKLIKHGIPGSSGMNLGSRSTLLSIADARIELEKK